jgi:hypothetical protein
MLARWSLTLFSLLFSGGCLPGGEPAAPSPEVRSRGIPMTAEGGEGCYRDFQPEGDAEGDLARLGAVCGQAKGLSPVTPVQVGERQSARGPVERFSFRARGGRCYRVFSVGEGTVGDLDVAVRDAEGRVVTADVSRDRWSVVPPRGLLCIEREGVYTLEVAVMEGSGGYVLQVWGS